MDFDLDAARTQFEPWNFAVKIGAKRHPVREITVEEFAALLANPPKPGSLEETQFLRGLFAEHKPDVAKWGPTLRDEVTTAISAYLNGYLEKKRARIHAMVAAGIRAQPST